MFPTAVASPTTNPGGDDRPLDYAPDGSRLVFDRIDPTRRARANEALFVAAANGLNTHRITPWEFADDQASWSPNGHLIAFAVASAQKGDIHGT